jgi:hypothetical protein
MGEQFGNSLYDKEIAQNAGLEQGRESSQTTNPAASTTSQASRTTAPAPIVRKYGDGVLVNGNIPEQEAYDQFKTKMGKAPASKDELRSWLAGQRSTHMEHQPAPLLLSPDPPDSHITQKGKSQCTKRSSSSGISEKTLKCVLHLPVNRSPLCLLPQIAATTTRMGNLSKKRHGFASRFGANKQRLATNISQREPCTGGRPINA